MKIFHQTYNFINERFRLYEFIFSLKNKNTRTFSGFTGFYFGGIIFLLFIIQLITGILIVLYYKGFPDLAYESVLYLNGEVKFGWFIRSLHSVTSDFLIFMVIIYMVNKFLSASFSKPKELSWYSGLFLLALAFLFGITGSLLPWNESSFISTKMVADVTGSIPFAGEFIRNIFIGGQKLTGVSLSRFYGLHISILPLIFILFLLLHFIFVIKVKNENSELPENVNDKNLKPVSFYPNFILRNLFLWFILINILILLSVFIPWEPGKKADEIIMDQYFVKPDWYILSFFNTLSFFPVKIFNIEGKISGSLLIFLSGIFWLMIPVFNRNAEPGKLKPWIKFTGIFLILLYIVLTVIGITV